MKDDFILLGFFRVLGPDFKDSRDFGRGIAQGARCLRDGQATGVAATGGKLDRMLGAATWEESAMAGARGVRARLPAEG